LNEIQYSDDIKAAFQEAKELIQYLSGSKLSLEEETDTRKILIEIVKLLVSSREIEDALKRILQIILTKLYRWTPHIKEFSGVEDLPVLMNQIVSSFDILMSEEITGELIINYFMNNIDLTIEEPSPTVISLSEILEIIEKFPTLEQFNNNLIGIINQRGDCINFTRLETDNWLIDLRSQGGVEDLVTLSDDSLSTETVMEIVKNFYTNIDSTKDLKKQLEVTEKVMEILRLEMELNTQISEEELVQNLSFTYEDAEFYLKLIKDSIDYEERDVPILKQKVKYVYRKLLTPNLYEVIYNLGMDFYTAKKVGKYLVDIGWVTEFPRSPTMKK
jgi:hypothetical protein